MKAITTIAKYTFIEAFRDKFVWFVFAFMLAGIPLGLFFKTLTLYGTSTVMPAVILDAISLSIAVVSVLYVNLATRRELDGRIMLVILSRPVSNSQYLLGKHFGFWLISFVYVLAGTILISVMKIATFSLAIKFAISLALLQIVVVAFSLFFALLLNSVAASVMVSGLSWALFNVTQTLWVMSDNSDSRIVEYTGKAFYYILPNYERYDLKHALLYGAEVDSIIFLQLIPYTLVYGLIVILCAWLDFSKKEY